MNKAYVVCLLKYLPSTSDVCLEVFSIFFSNCDLGIDDKKLFDFMRKH